MKVNQKEIHRTVKVMSKVADARASLAALTCVRLLAQDGNLTITATDLTQTLSRTIPCDGDIDICVPSKTLAVLTKPSNARAHGIAELNLLDSGAVELLVEGMTTHLETIPAADFPNTVSGETGDKLGALENNLAADALAFTIPVASVDPSRPHICCVALRDNLAISTDGHRLHTHPLPLGNEREILIPVESAKTIQSVLKDGAPLVVEQLLDDTSMLRLHVGDWQMDTRLLDSQFPPYTEIIPKGHDTVVRLDAGKLHKALKRLDGLAKGAGVRLTLNGAVRLQSEHPDVGDASVIVDFIESNHRGEDLIVGFNPAYLLDAIGKAGVVAIELAGDLDPLVVRRGDQITGVVMPMRI